MTKKGFTLLEVLLTLFIVASFFTVILKSTNDVNLDWLTFSNEYLSLQADSLINKTSNQISDYSFNSSGKVNRADTLSLARKELIIHLGTGYLTHD